MSIQTSKRLASLMCLLAMLNFVSCGSDKDSNDNSQQEEAQGDQGSFEAHLAPLNASVATTSGNAFIGISGDLVNSQVTVQNAPANMVHKQFIFTKGPCPTASNDVNRDGFIDYQEALTAVESIFIPLDNNLDDPGMGTFPMSNSSGFYSYQETGSLAVILANLGISDLNLIGRTVMVFGVSKKTMLPPTVATNGYDSAQTSLPIACGALVRSSRPVPPPPAPKPQPQPYPQPMPVPVPGPVAICPVTVNFFQVLGDGTTITGQRCFGGESAGGLVCNSGQFIVTLDGDKSIGGPTTDTTTGEDPAGGGTVGGGTDGGGGGGGGGGAEDSAPFIVGLRRATNSLPPQQCTFNFNALSPIADEDLVRLNSYQVRFFGDGDSEVLQR